MKLNLNQLEEAKVMFKNMFKEIAMFHVDEEEGVVMVEGVGHKGEEQERSEFEMNFARRLDCCSLSYWDTLALSKSCNTEHRHHCILRRYLRNTELSKNATVGNQAVLLAMP